MDHSTTSVSWPGSLQTHIYSPATGVQQISLLDALTSDLPARFEHPMGYLTTPMMMKNSAVLQAIFDAEGGLDAEEWAAVVFDAQPLAERWLEAIRRVAENPLAGFFLEGDAAFKQIPLPLASTDPTGEIDGLFEPIRDRIGASSKALRMPTRRMGQICPACAAIGLYLNHHFSNAKAQFWGTSPARGALAAVARLDLAGKAAGLRRTLLVNVLHRDFAGWSQPEPLPWAPDKAGFNGLNADGRPPLERLLNPPECLKAPANLQLPLIRGLRLEPATTSGRCGCCGQNSATLYSHYRIVPEPALLQQFSPATQEALKGEKSKVLAKMLMPEARHPCLGYRPSKEDDATYLPITFLKDSESVDKTRPTWVALSYFLVDVPAKPDLFRQLIIKLSVKSGFVQEGVEMHLDVALFGITFKGSTNPNVRAIFNDQYGFAASAWSEHFSKNLATAITALRDTVSRCVQAWIEGALRFDYDVKRTQKDDKEKLESAKPGGTRLKTAGVYLNASGALHALAAQLWEAAYAQVSQWLEEPALLQGEAGEEIRASSCQSLEQEADRLWRDYRKWRIGGQTDFETLFLDHEAHRAYSRSLKKPRSKQEKKA